MPRIKWKGTGKDEDSLRNQVCKKRLQTCNSWIYTPSLAKVKLTTHSQPVRRAVYHLTIQRAKLSLSEQQNEYLWMSDKRTARAYPPVCKRKHAALPGSSRPLARLYQQFRKRRGILHTSHLPSQFNVETKASIEEGSSLSSVSERKEQKQLQGRSPIPIK